MKRTLGVAALAALFLLGSMTPTPVAAKRPGTGGGGTTCPTTVTTAAQLQSALDCANPGATITLRQGTYEGSFTLRYKPTELEADGVTPKRITIQSELADLLGDGRVRPAKDIYMAWLKVPAGSSSPVVITELKTLADGTRRAASHYRFTGIKFFTDQWVNKLVVLGSGTERLVQELPGDISFDRSYFAGSPGEGTKQGLVANGNGIVVTNSYFKDFKDTANDAQAIIIWNGGGPFIIENNYLEGSGENMMIGGGDPTIPNLVPSDAMIRHNHFFKPTAWTFETSTQPGSASGRKWRVKNLFELKNAQRVMVDGNVFENNWIQADQQGFAILLSVRNQTGGAPWSRIADVTFKNNVIRNSIAGMKFLATDDTFSSGQLDTVLVQNNVFVNINANAMPGTDPGDRAGRLIQVMNPSTTPIDIGLTVDRNTAFSTAEASFSVWQKLAGYAFTNNVVRHNACTNAVGNNCGISGDGTLPGNDTLSHWFVAGTASVSGNILYAAGADRTATYPVGNSFPATVTFGSSIDLVTGKPSAGTTANYTVVGASGKGADWSVVKTHEAAAISGQP